MNIAIVVAAGGGTRMNTEESKQFMGLAGKPVLAHCLLAFESASSIDGIIVVVRSQDVDRCRKNIIERYGIKKLRSIVTGGDRRQDSVMAGLMELPPEAEAVCIHDGARPFVTEEQIERILSLIGEFDGVVLGIPVVDTIKRADVDDVIIETLNRQGLWLIQTPQAFRPQTIFKAYQQARIDSIIATDDAVLVERIGGRIKIEPGSQSNMKITHPEDLMIAEMLMQPIVRPEN